MADVDAAWHNLLFWIKFATIISAIKHYRKPPSWTRMPAHATTELIPVSAARSAEDGVYHTTLHHSQIISLNIRTSISGRRTVSLNHIIHLIQAIQSRGLARELVGPDPVGQTQATPYVTLCPAHAREYTSKTLWEKLQWTKTQISLWMTRQQESHLLT